MKSKEVRKVILRTSRMKRVRNNLRIVLKLAIKDELSSLAKLERLYRQKEKKDGLTLSQEKRYSYVVAKYRELSKRYNHSILRCGSGAACYSLDEAIERGFNPRDRPADLNLVWVPWLRRWFCLKCFVLKQMEEMTHEDFDDPLYREWVKEEFDI